MAVMLGTFWLPSGTDSRRWPGKADDRADEGEVGERGAPGLNTPFRAVFLQDAPRFGEQTRRSARARCRLAQVDGAFGHLPHHGRHVWPGSGGQRRRRRRGPRPWRGVEVEVGHLAAADEVEDRRSITQNFSFRKRAQIIALLQPEVAAARPPRTFRRIRGGERGGRGGQDGVSRCAGHLLHVVLQEPPVPHLRAASYQLTSRLLNQ